MSIKLKINNLWKTSEDIRIKVGGTWKIPQTVWIKVDGVWKQWFLRGGVLDQSFMTNIGSNASDYAYSLGNQADGKILIGGMTNWNGSAANYLVRLNSNGTRDTTFNLGGVGPNSVLEPRTIACQEDGKIICGGLFKSWNGTTANGLIRLNSNGTVDSNFLNNIGTAFGTTSSYGAFHIYIQPDGKIIVSGYINVFNGTTARGIIRLNPDGTKDSAFITNIGDGPSSSAGSVCSKLQLDGKIIVAGAFTSWNGVTGINRMVRLNSDGTRDTTFSSNMGTGFNATIQTQAMDVQSDNKVLAAGNFTSFNGISVNKIVRLNSDGTLDSSFTSNAGISAANDTYATIIKVQDSGKIILANNYTFTSSPTVKNIIRLNSDGTRDVNFTTNTGNSHSGQVNGVIVRPDGKILTCGSFPNWSGTSNSPKVLLLGGDIA